jgi:hypothetical protein
MVGGRPVARLRGGIDATIYLGCAVRVPALSAKDLRSPGLIEYDATRFGGDVLTIARGAVLPDKSRRTAAPRANLVPSPARCHYVDLSARIQTSN